MTPFFEVVQEFRNSGVLGIRDSRGLDLRHRELVLATQSGAAKTSSSLVICHEVGGDVPGSDLVLA